MTHEFEAGDPYFGTMSLWTMPGYATVTMKRKQLKEFLYATGGQILANGHLWDIKTTHLGLGVYNVTTIQRKFDSDEIQN